MPTTRKQKSKARKSREADMLSDFENLNILLGIAWREEKVSSATLSVGLKVLVTMHW